MYKTHKILLSLIILFISFYIPFTSNATSSYISPEEFGAIGDGITDDTVALQQTFKYVISHPNTIIEFGHNKNYLIKGGLVIAKTSILHGNNSTITVKEISNFTEGGNFKNQFFMLDGYNEHSYLLDWKDLTIDFSPSLLLNENGTTKEYMLFHFYDLETFKFNNITITSNGDSRNCINLLKFSGQGNIYINDCDFSINHRGKIGSIIWIQSTLSGGYYARINNCSFYSTTWDEIISNFCSGSHDVEFNNCTIEKHFHDTYYNKEQQMEVTTGPFINTYYSTKLKSRNHDISHHVTFNHCNMICSPISPNSDVYITFCGLTSYYGDVALTNFINCNIDARNVLLLLGSEKTTDECSSILADNNLFHETVKATFNHCNINLEMGKFGLLKSTSCNLEIKNSTITTNKLIDSTYTNANPITSYQFTLINNDIIFTSPVSTIFTVNKVRKEKYIITSNNFYTPNSNATFLTETESSYWKNSIIFSHPTNAEYQFYAKNNSLNDSTAGLIIH